MLGIKRTAAAAALGIAALFSGAASADNSPASLSRLANVPVFFLADASGAPIIEPGAADPTFYLTRSQASLGLGMLIGERAAEHKSTDVHVAVTDLAASTSRPGEEHYVKPVTTLDAAASLDGVPLFIVRDKNGAPFTINAADGKKKVYFYLSEDDARDFVHRVVNETHRSWDDIRLSVIPLNIIINSMLNSKDPSVSDWVIYPSAETRSDAAALKAQASLEPQKKPK